MTGGTIWDPLRRKEVKATPEEVVRQWFVRTMQDSMGIPAHMMMTEVGFRFGEKAYRADIMVYGRDAKPLAVVECKRPEVELTPEVARQALKYNTVLDVRWIFLTNGSFTRIYRRESDVFVPAGKVPTYEEMLG